MEQVSQNLSCANMNKLTPLALVSWRISISDLVKNACKNAFYILKLSPSAQDNSFWMQNPYICIAVTSNIFQLQVQTFFSPGSERKGSCKFAINSY